MAHLPEFPTDLLIDGAWRAAAGGGRFVTSDPASGAPIAEVAEAGAADIDGAVAAAQRALAAGPWAMMSGADRGRVLNRLAALLRARFEEIVALESLDAGKPVAATRRQDVPAAIDCLEHFAGWADKLAGETIPARPDAFTYTTRAPVGVVGVIVPWNFPLMNAVWQLASALACGCAIVLKPAELTPLSALWLGRLALEAGLPPGVLNVVPGPGPVAGAALAAHPGVAKISFTGSPPVGRDIMRLAAGNITRVGLELGGKSANIVFADADLESAARHAVSGAFFNAGQVCSVGARILVEDRIHDEFVDRLVERVRRLRVGDPADPRTTMGPLISETQMRRVLDHVEIGRREGAQLATGGSRIGASGWFVEPTVFVDVGGAMRVAREEIFGPVVTVQRFRDAAQAVRLANEVPYSLAAAVWSRDVDRAHQAARALRAGTVWVNTYGPTDARLPWGGMGGESGIGRDLGRAALDNYTELKTVWLQLRQAAA